MFHDFQRPVLQMKIAFAFFCSKHFHGRQSARYRFEIIRLQELRLFRALRFLIFHSIPPCIYSRPEWQPPALSSLSVPFRSVYSYETCKRPRTGSGAAEDASMTARSCFAAVFSLRGMPCGLRRTLQALLRCRRARSCPSL